MKKSNNIISDWLDKYGDPEIDKKVEEELERMMNKEEEYNPYCPICDSCGEDGCCSATSCKQHPEGKYCETYLKELKFGYLMYHKLSELIDGDEKYQSEVDKIWDELYDKVFKDE